MDLLKPPELTRAQADATSPQEDLQSLCGPFKRYFAFAGRLRSFQELGWPYQDGICSAERMAIAGFYKLNEHDDVKCAFCLKELCGWEQGDDPWKEHLDHSPQCLFAKLGKQEQNLTVCELVLLARHQLFSLLVSANISIRN